MIGLLPKDNLSGQDILAAVDLLNHTNLEIEFEIPIYIFFRGGNYV